MGAITAMTLGQSAAQLRTALYKNRGSMLESITPSMGQVRSFDHDTTLIHLARSCPHFITVDTTWSMPLVTNTNESVCHGMWL